MANASLQPLYERLNGVADYHPLSANTFTDWAMEAGDIVKVVRGDEEYNVPIQSTSLVWKGSQQITIESNGKKERDSIAKSSARKYGRCGAAVRSSQNIYREMYSEDGYLHSYVLMTESILRTEFEASISGVSGQLYSAIEQTATYVMTEVTNVQENLHTEIIQTASYIIEHVGGANRKYTQWTAPTGTSENPLREGDIWVKTNYTRTWDDAEGYTWDMLEQYTWDNLKGSSVYEYHNGSWKLILNEMELGKDTDIIKTRDHVSIIAKDLKNTKDGLTGDVAELRVQANQIRSTVVDMRNDLGSAITQTASQIRSEVHAANSQLYSAIEQTATYIRSYVNDEINDLGSEILQTASQIRAEVHASQSNLYSYVDQTATYIRSEVASVESGLMSSITQTASQIRAEVANTASSLQSSITQESNRISLVVEGTGTNAKIKPASIVTAINNGASSVIISASHINLDGYVKATDITSDFINTKVSNIATLTGQGATFTGNVKASGGFTVIGASSAQGAQTHDLTYSIVDKMIKTASVSSNTLTLTRFDGTLINFSKATSLDGEWSGTGKLTVTATPQDEHFERVLSTGSTSLSGNVYTVPIKAQYGTQTIYTEDTGFTVTVDASARYYAGSSNVNLDDPSANAKTSLDTTRIWTIKTNGRKNSSGSADELSVTVPLHLYANGWSSGTNTVYLKWGGESGSSGTNYARINVSMPTNMTFGTQQQSSSSGTYSYDFSVNINGNYAYTWLPISLGGKTYRVRIHPAT